jgi:hypothetical protein
MLPVRFVIPIEQMWGDDSEDTELLRSMAAEAGRFISSFPWCGSIEGAYFGAGVGKIIAIFFFLIRPSPPSSTDRALWVIVGDIPPAYLVTDFCKTPSEALRTYIHEMKRWVELAKKGRSASDVIPVNVPPTPKWARQVSGRLKFLEQNLLPRFYEDEQIRA